MGIAIGRTGGTRGGRGTSE